MRTSTILLLVVVAVCTGGAVYGQAQSAADAAPSRGLSEFRGELTPDPETGCIEVPDDPGLTPRLQPYGAPDGGADAHPHGGEVAPDDIHRFAAEDEEWPDHDVELYRQPWPVCEEPEVSVVSTDDREEGVDVPTPPGH